MGLEALPVSCIGSGTGWQMYCVFPLPPHPPSSPLHTPPFHFSSPWLGGNRGGFCCCLFFFIYCTWYLGYLFWIWCSTSIPDLNCKLCNTSVTSCVSLGVALNAWSLPIKMSVFFYEYWNSKALARIPKWHHSLGIKVSCSKYFVCEEFKCCQLFPKWFDVRLILDFCVSLHPHFMMHFGEQKTPYYFFVSPIGQ